VLQSRRPVGGHQRMVQALDLGHGILAGQGRGGISMTCPSGTGPWCEEHCGIKPGSPCELPEKQAQPKGSVRDELIRQVTQKGSALFNELEKCPRH
jgi:hypothetical protein